MNTTTFNNIPSVEKKRTHSLIKKTGFLLLASAITLSACVSLEEDPESFISPDEFYKTSGDAIAAVNAIYFHLNANAAGQQPIYNSLFNTGMDFLTDDITAGPGSPNPDVRS